MNERAAGLRAIASHAAAPTLPCPCAASPAAIAMAKPEVIATQFVAGPALQLVCAKAGTARIENIINSNITIFRIVFSL